MCKISSRAWQTLAKMLVCGIAVGGLSVQSTRWAQAAEEKSSPAAGSPAAEIVVGNPARIEVYPAQVQLAGPRRRMHLVVTAHYADGTVQDLTSVAQYRSSQPQVAVVEEGVVRPLADGQAEISVEVGAHRATAQVEVVKFGQPEPVSFQYETLVALSKHGCNSGACHGSPSGKGGFRLSLRAYDPVLDADTLVREAFNRRTNPQDPAQSLLLRKPVMELAHGGGQRLKKTDLSYQLLHDWIGQGLRLDSPDAAVCDKVEVYPPQRILKRPAHRQQMLVLAHFTDGSVRDVTPLTSFSSSDEAVASVDEQGLVIGQTRGESAILVRYLDKMETAYLTFLEDVPGFKWPNPPANNYVDELVFQKLEQLQIQPSELCSDEEFVRRVYLDVIGILPTTAEMQQFVSDPSSDRRAQLIDRLLERPEYAEFWGLRWGDLLRVNGKKVSAAGVHKFRHWIVASLRDNKPYDEFVRELLLSQGSTFDNPPANYFRTATDTNDCTETTSQLFLGVRIQCAKCHNHPFERWTQDNYYGIGAFFNRIQRKKTANADDLVIFMGRSGEVTQPRTGKQMKPWLPLTGEVDLPGEDDRRVALVDWLGRADNPLFAQVGVNRLWGYLMGRGIVEPVDDFRASNPPSNAALLDRLAQEFIASKFDQKQMLRTMLNSRTYQLSSRKNDFNQIDTKYFSHYGTRLLAAEPLLDAICQVTGVQEKFKGLPAGTKATQLPSPDVDNYFLKVFGQPPREMACACERSSESNLSQALQMINGPLVHGKLRDTTNRFRQLAAAGKSDEEIVTDLYLAAICRPPSSAEREAALKHIAAQSDRMLALEDVCWALLNAKEFLFQH